MHTSVKPYRNEHDVDHERVVKEENPASVQNLGPTNNSDKPTSEARIPVITSPISTEQLDHISRPDAVALAIPRSEPVPQPAFKVRPARLRSHSLPTVWGKTLPSIDDDNAETSSRTNEKSQGEKSTTLDTVRRLAGLFKDAVQERTAGKAAGKRLINLHTVLLEELREFMSIARSKSGTAEEVDVSSWADSWVIIEDCFAETKQAANKLSKHQERIISIDVDVGKIANYLLEDLISNGIQPTRSGAAATMTNNADEADEPPQADDDGAVDPQSSVSADSQASGGLSNFDTTLEGPTPPTNTMAATSAETAAMFKSAKPHADWELLPAADSQYYPAEKSQSQKDISAGRKVSQADVVKFFRWLTDRARLSGLFISENSQFNTTSLTVDALREWMNQTIDQLAKNLDKRDEIEKWILSPHPVPMFAGEQRSVAPDEAYAYPAHNSLTDEIDTEASGGVDLTAPQLEKSASAPADVSLPANTAISTNLSEDTLVDRPSVMQRRKSLT